MLLLVTHAENEGIVLPHDNPFICIVGRRQVPNEVSFSSDDNIYDLSTMKTFLLRLVIYSVNLQI